MRNNWSALVILIARLSVAAVFIAAALPKIKEPDAFAESVQAFRWLGPNASAWVALILPWLELALGWGLITRWLRQISGYVILALLLGFIALYISAWARGLNLVCGCFGHSDGPSTNYLIAILRNSALLGATALVVLHDFKQATRAKFSK